MKRAPHFLSYFLFLGFILVALMIVSIMLGRNEYASHFFSLIYITVIASALYYIFKFSLTIEWFIITICLFVALINITLNSSELSFAYFFKYIGFAVFLIMCTINVNWSLQEHECKLIGKTILLLATSIGLCYYLGLGYDGVWMALTLNFPNPNATGVFISNILMYIIIFFVGRAMLQWHRIYILWGWFCFVVLLYLLGLTYCRSSILSIAVMLFLVCFDKRLSEVVLSKFTAWAFVLAPVVFVWFYVSVAGDLGIGDAISFEVEDVVHKSEDSRLVIWEPALNTLKDHWLIGDYYGISEGTGRSQLHNTHLDVWCSYGIIPFFLFLIFLYRIIRSINSKTNITKFNRYALYAFLSCWISGIFEATLVTGQFCLFILSCGFVILANSNICQCKT